MLVRIVKMGFKEEYVDDFLTHFHANKQYIRAFKGCSFLELYQDKNNPTIFFTYSYWETDAALENYRNSSLFKEVWKTTKQWFKQKPEAWSVNKIVSLN